MRRSRLGLGGTLVTIYIMGLNVENIFTSKEKLLIMVTVIEMVICIVCLEPREGNQKHHVHRFIWECYNGLITDGLIIDHINDIRDDNRLCNLQLMTQQENCKTSAKNRDYIVLLRIIIKIRER